MDEYTTRYRFTVHDRTATFKFVYPRTDSEKVQALVVDLEDVRASDGIRISYDFDRDGWVIEQPSVFQWELGDKVMDEGWRETAFCASWPFYELDRH